MDTEEPCTVKIPADDARRILLYFLYDRYEKGGKKDYVFTVKKIAKGIQWSPYLVSNCARHMKKKNILAIEMTRNVCDLWKTNFSDKTKEELYETIRI